MDTHRFDQALLATLDDERLSRTERRALRELIQEQALSPGQIAQLRSRVFTIARQQAKHVSPNQMLQWVDDTLKVLHTSETPASRLAKVLFSPGDDCASALIQLFETAKTSVDVCVFTITDDRVTQALIAAQKRGVRVRVITDDDKSLDAGSDVARIGRAGVPVCVDRTRHHMHHKYAVFDGKTAVSGSYNWTRSASRHNHENLILTDDQRLISAFERSFRELWSELS